MTARTPIVLVNGKPRELSAADYLSTEESGRLVTLKETVFAGMATQTLTSGVAVTLDGYDYVATFGAGGSAAIVAAGLKMTAPNASAEMNFAFAGGQGGLAAIIGNSRWRRGRWGMWWRLASYDWSAGTVGYTFGNPSTNYPYHGVSVGRARNTLGSPNTSAGGIWFQTWWNSVVTSYTAIANSDDCFLVYSRSPFEFEFYSGVYSGGWPTMEAMTMLGAARFNMQNGLAVSTTNYKEASAWTPYWVLSGNNNAMNVVIDRWRVTGWE